jgi:transglutaminase-like putative cysteine protease
MALHPARTYRVSHRTEYRYEADVAPSYGQLHLQPRDGAGQRCRSTEIVIDPEPDEFRERIDFFGNRTAYVAIQTPHRALTVTATSVVDVEGQQEGVSLFSGAAWEVVRHQLHRDRSAEGLDARQFALASPLISASPVYAEYAAPSFLPGRPLLEALVDLSSRIHQDFTYRPGATSVATPLDEVFAGREGVCQDFTHVALACLRSVGLAARYVSGYLETRPPPGRPRLKGADASHAWASVAVPRAGWVDIDPTNDRLVNDRYIITAWGRDYSDVAPLNGVIYTEGKTESMKVEVDVEACAD